MTSNPSRPRILLADDDQELTHLLRDFLSRESFDVTLGQAIELSRLETDAGARSEPVELGALLEDVIGNADYEGAPRDCRVAFIERTPLTVNGSRDALGSALENIVRNALAYTADSTAVEVRLSRDGDDAVIAVRDFGPGVSDPELHRIFEPFYRTDSARARSSGGTGLVLTIAHRAISRDRGSLVARNAEGGGLQVEVRLPVT